jgi:hypothetical protein
MSLCMKYKAVIAFRSVEIDMDNCVDCTERDRRSLPKLYNQVIVQGTRVCGINYCLFGGKTLYTVSLLYIQGFAESCIYNKKTGEQFRSPVSH